MDYLYNLSSRIQEKFSVETSNKCSGCSSVVLLLNKVKGRYACSRMVRLCFHQGQMQQLFPSCFAPLTVAEPNCHGERAPPPRLRGSSWGSEGDEGGRAILPQVSLSQLGLVHRLRACPLTSATSVSFTRLFFDLVEAVFPQNFPCLLSFALYDSISQSSTFLRSRTVYNRRIHLTSEAPSYNTIHHTAIMSVPRGLSSVLKKAPSDVVILSSLRTAICRSNRGQLKDAYPEELLSTVLKATLEANPNLDPRKIEDVAVGVVLSELGGSKAARMAMNHVGYPNETSLYTVNRACSSSLQSIALVAAQIRTEAISVGIGAGMESMTRNYGSRAIPVDVWPALKDSPVKDARDCIMPMGITSENVAERYGVSRADQDAFAVRSHQNAARAREDGSFASEIVPVTTRYQEVDKQGNKVGEEQTITVTKDDGIRANIGIEALQKLKPAFKSDGASTAGNSSQVSDGAAATLLMRRSTATELGLTDSIIGKFVGATTVGCAPDEMGVGPALAIPKLLGQFGLENKDVNRWEINEAFASQAIYCLRALGLEQAYEDGKVNPDGGAIALGHPLGATGARMTSTLLHGLGRSGGEVGVVSMCVGTGMGMAGLFVRE
ncbi:Putative thiolase [Colletotrichum destructivum]|uniref:acetyl-CoA C-acyltransferase n=1 Tax=Colletotrichum destructivum TaxID=34406 RepID=A0AAX4IU83_9PEZI|nr:Putative thiolase [Colletotrichum destructivum]